MDVKAFVELLDKLQSSDNEVRKSAEATYEQIEATDKIAALLEAYSVSGNESKSTILVFLRRVISRDWDEFWDKLSAENKQHILDKILHLIVHEQDMQIRKKLADVTAEIAGNLIHDETGAQTWTGVLELLDHCISSDDAAHNYIALLIVSGCPNVFGSSADKFTGKMKSLFAKTLVSPDAQVRSTSVKSVVNFVTENEDDDSLVKTMSSIIPAVIQACGASTDEDDFDGPLSSFADLASTVPKLITSHLAQVLQMCLPLASNKELSEAVRQNALEVIVSYIESAPKSLKKHAPQSIPHIVEVCMLFMSDMDDEILPEWLEDTEEDDEFEDSPMIGESSLDRVACALNGKVLLPAFLPVVERYITSNDWKMKHAALRAFSAVGEGCQRAMEPQIEKFMAHVVKFAGDEHPRVRYAACNAIGQMSTDFAPSLQKKCHNIVVPALLNCLEDASCVRVCSHAASALVNFSEECPKTVIGPYLPFLLQKLERLLEATYAHLAEKKYQNVVENAVTAIASVADAAQDLFKEHYARLVPSLVHILQSTDVEGLKELRGKTIECISLIGFAVGKEVFSQDAINIMNLLSGSMTSLAIDDPQYSYMISSWTRFCAILGADFAPFLPIVMEPVLRAAEYRPDVNIYQGDDEADDEDGVEYHNLGNSRIGIRTSGLEEKATSCDMLVAFAKEMKGAFAPWVEKVAELSIKNIGFNLHDSVRQSSAEVMPALLECVKDQGVAAMRRLWVEFLKTLCSEISGEEDIELAGSFMTTIARCIDILGAEGLSTEDITAILEIVHTQIQKYGRRKADRIHNEDEDDGDEIKEELDDELQLESDFLGSISEIIHSLMKETSGAVFENLVQVFATAVELMQSPAYYFERQWGMCIFDDAIEFSNEHVFTRLPALPLMAKLLSDEYPEVRQAAAYGFGVMAMKAHTLPAYNNDILQGLQDLAQMIEKPDSRSTEEGTVATENAIAAFAKIIMNASLDRDTQSKCIQMFLTWLPTHNDQEESPYIYTCFCELFAKNDPAFLGENNSNLPRIVQIALSAIRDEAFDESAKGREAKHRVIELVRHIRSNEQLFTKIVEHLDQSLITVVQMIN